jgi:hypothetical protein
MQIGRHGTTSLRKLSINGMRRGPSAIMTDAEVHRPETPYPLSLKAAHMNDAR